VSLALALRAVDGFVLATDSRATEGYTLEGPRTRDDSVKFIQLNDDCGVLTYGLSDIGHTGITNLKECVSKKFKYYNSLPRILDRAMDIFNRVSSDWEKGNSEVRRRDNDVGFVLAGYERGEKAFRVFNLQSPNFLPRRIKNGCLLAGQWHVSKFLMNKLYTKDMSVDALKHLAVFLLNSTMSVEKTVGGTIRLATITKSESFEWVSEDEVRCIAENNKIFRNFFQEQFYSALLSVVNNNPKETSEDLRKCQITLTG
jgi:20S proteasome alpha/beta subunit